MRLKSEIWVQAFLRANAAAGKFGAVLHKGASEAGAVYVVVNHMNGLSTLLGPPPGPAYNEQGERLFRKEMPQPLPWPEVSSRIERYKKFDRDIWIVEIEDKSAHAGLNVISE